jgi:hypothetical protein
MANATITVLEADGTTETDVVVLDVGRQAAAASKSVTTATEDKAVLDAIAASLAVLDDFDETDRAKVNLIVGQAGIAAGVGASGATVPRVTLATDSPAAAVRYVTVDMTAATNALTAGDVAAATQVVAACTAANDAPGILQSMVVIDPDDQGANLKIVFFSANTTLGTEESAPDIDDTEVQTVLGIVDVATTDYVDLGGSKVATKLNLGLPILPATGTDDIYVAIMAVATPTFAGGHIYLRLGFM